MMRGEPKGAFKCPRCGSTTWGNLQFCTECGQSLNVVCPECGETWRYYYGEDRKFCPSCGARISKMRETG